MNGNDIADFRPRVIDLVTALALLTRLRLPELVFPDPKTRPMAHAAWAYPLVGVVVGLLAGCAGWVTMALGLPATAAALFVMLAGVLITGAMHEDGLADCADGFWGGWTRARRLEIMKDSQIGTYGVVALVLGLGLKWVAITAILSTGVYFAALVCAALVSRSAMVAVMYALPSARLAGLSSTTGCPPKNAALIALGFGVIGTVVAMPAVAVSILVMATGATLAVALIAKSKIGGQTGDVLGATQQVVETAILLTCLASLT